jgi:PAS domain S-box-containing protein
MAAPETPQPEHLGIGRLFWQVRDAVIVGDASTGTIVLWNPAAEALFGYPAAEAIGQPMEILVPEALRPRHRAGLARYASGTRTGPVIDSPTAVELPAVRKSGEALTIELTLSPLGLFQGVQHPANAGGPGAHASPDPAGPAHGTRPGVAERPLVLALVRDVTARVRAEAALARRLAELSALAQALGSAQEPLAAFRAFRDFAAATLPCSGLFVSLYDAERQERTCVYAWSEGAEVDVSALPSLPMNESPNSRVIREGRTIVVDDYQAAVAGLPVANVGLERDPRLPASSVTAPLAVLGRRIGAIEVQSTALGAFSPEHAATLTTAATMVAVAVENARLLEREREARDRAVDAVRQRDEFLATAAHELKTPLTSVRGASQLALRRIERDAAAGRAPDAATTARHFQLVDDQASRLDRLIAQLLDVARLERGALALSPVQTDVSRLVEEMVATLRDSGRTNLVAHVQPGVHAVIDPLRIEQVLGNLLENASKYGGAGEIEVVLRTQGDHILLSVRDHGPGIPEEHRDRIFDRYYQAHADEHRSGLGLGLHVTRQIVELHGGSIAVEQPPGGGARFVVTLPAHPEHSEHPGNG